MAKAGEVLQRVRRLFSSEYRDRQLQERLQQLRQRTPVPVFWLFGKTQSGKTSVIKYLTGADAAEIGHGFQPCTRFSRLYQFPTPEAPLVTFLDTRGLDEPNYDPAEDLARFNSDAHVVLVTVKALDHAQENVLAHLRTIRAAKASRPVVLVLTTLHEAYPQQQHPEPYPFKDGFGRGPQTASQGPETAPEHTPGAVPEPLARSLDEQRHRFEGLVDYLVPIDLTRPEEGFHDPNYGGQQLIDTLLTVLPHAYRETLLTLEEGMRELRDLYARHALPHIIAYSTLAASAGAIPIPWVDLFLIPGIQTRMIHHLADYYGQPLSATRFLELASTTGMGMLVRQAARELVKFIPYLGSVVGGAFAAASTFALGKAFCYYYSAVHQGHVPRPEELRRYYIEQLTLAEQAWSSLKTKGMGGGS
jgi:uncharacterized protein (DUF697 family)